MARKSKRKLLEEDVTDWVMSILATPAVIQNPGFWISDALSRLIPDSVDHDTAVRIAADVTRRIIADPPPPNDVTNLSYRSMLAVESVNRALGALKTVDADRPLSDALTAWNASEDHYHQLHNEASQQRSEAQQEINRLRREHGDVLSWNHLNTAKTHRPAHVKAHGKNFSVSSPPKSTEGLFPGMALHCDCVAGPPIRGAKMLR